MDRGNADGALKACESALEINERSGGALHVRGRALLALGRGDEGLESLGQAHAVGPENGYIANTIGWRLIQLGREEEALPFLEQARDRLQSVSYVRYNVGVAYERTGRIEQAVEEYRAAAMAGDSEGRAQSSLERLEPVLTRMTAEGKIPPSSPDAAVARSAHDAGGSAAGGLVPDSEGGTDAGQDGTDDHGPDR
jgi:tetratricopeptide (TPR) repeat protein